MKKSLNLTIFISVIFAAMFVSCKKNHSEGGSSEKLTVEDATSYLQRLESKYGNYDTIKIAGKTEKNFKTVDFSKAYVGENETSFFVEAPISYTSREIVLSTGSSIPKVTLNKMLSNSFDRFVVYKDKGSGMVSEKIVTVIPSADYLNNDHSDLYNNHYLSIVKDFSGFVSYKDWKGKFLSSKSYNLGNAGVTMQAKAARVNEVRCNTETIYRGYYWCEDFDQWGNGVNCDEAFIAYEAIVCKVVDPFFVDHSAPIPGSNDTYWQNWPDPSFVPPYNTCPTGVRVNESPILYAAVNATTFSVSVYGGCECPGYSFIILEDVPTGTEYSFPIVTHNYLKPDCNTLWETNVQIPASVPNGEYFVKVWFDGDVFYHQFEQDGTILRRFSHTLFR